MNTEKEKFTVLHGLLLVESAALFIGIAMALTPSKTGSAYSLADHFFDNPSFLQEVTTYFLLTNIGVLFITLCIGIWYWVKKT